MLQSCCDDDFELCAVTRSANAGDAALPCISSTSSARTAARMIAIKQSVNKKEKVSRGPGAGGAALGPPHVVHSEKFGGRRRRRVFIQGS